VPADFVHDDKGVDQVDLAELHGQNNLTKQTALSEKGEIINGRGDTSPHRRRSALQASSASRACVTEVPLLR
jgi:hypothetical protein